MNHYKLNTSNPGKLEEFKRLFAKHGATLESSSTPIKEIDADPLTVITHKACQVNEGTVVEDTVLDVSGAQIGIHVKWLLEHLSQYIGKEAHWKVFLAYRKGEQVYVFLGEVKGTIVDKRGSKGFGFDPVFQPAGSPHTLAESKPDTVNARAHAVDNLVHMRPLCIQKPIRKWEGPWQ